MKWLLRFWYFLTCCCFAVFAWGSPKPLSLTFGYDNVATVPWYTPEQHGYVFEILKLADDELSDIDFKFRGLPWRRCLEELEVGAIDGCFSSTHTVERAKKGLFPLNAAGEVDSSRSLFKSSYSLMVPSALKSSVKIDGLKIVGWNMKHRIGVNLHYAIAQDLEPGGYSLEFAPSLESNKMKLLNGRVMALADVTSRLESLKKGGEMPGFEILTPPLTEREFHLMLSRHIEKLHPTLPDQIWNKLAEVRAQKRIAEPAPVPSLSSSKP